MKLTIFFMSFVYVFSICVGACSPKLPDDLPSLINLMASNDMKVHTAAARKVQDVYGVDGLLAALDNPQPGAKIQAARFLRLNPDQRARLPLLVATRHEDAHVRGWAAFALSSVPSPEVEKRLNELLSDPAQVVQNFAKEAHSLLVEKKKKAR